MARKKIDLAKFEGKWVWFKIRHYDKLGNVLYDQESKAFVKNGKLMSLNYFAIQTPGLKLFIEVAPRETENETEKLIDISEKGGINTPAEKALARLEFGEPPLPAPQLEQLQKTLKKTEPGINVKMIKSRKYPGVLILRAFGLHNYNEDPPSREFEKNLEAVFEKKPKVIILDLGHVKRLDSVERGGLAKFYSECKGKDITLLLCSLHPSVKLVLSITRLDTLMQSYKNEKEALAALA